MMRELSDLDLEQVAAASGPNAKKLSCAAACDVCKACSAPAAAR